MIVLTKNTLWDFLKKRAIEERPVEVLGELEMLELLNHFFDRAIYYSARGYELRQTEPKPFDRKY